MAQTWRGCATTTNVVQQQQYGTSSLHGVKRSHEQINPVCSDSIVFKDVTIVSSARDLAKRQCLDIGGKNRIVASRICNLPSHSNDWPDEDLSKQPVLPISGPSQNPLLLLSHPRYGLPETLVSNFVSLGISSIYPWQSSCLLGRGLLDGGKNLVYTAPTGGGKSLVADVLMLKRVINDPSKKAILVLPYVALVQEKLKWLSRVVEGVQKETEAFSQFNSQLPTWRRPHSSSVRVVGFFGGSKARATWSDVDVAVCTIEKVS